MSYAIPIQDLKDTAKVSQMCSESCGQIYITKDCAADMVILNVQAYEERLAMADIYAKLDAAEEDIRCGRTSDAIEFLKSLRAKYNV